jgi:hypothetical protein
LCNHFLKQFYSFSYQIIFYFKFNTGWILAVRTWWARRIRFSSRILRETSYTLF